MIQRISRRIDFLGEWIGKTFSWLTLGMVLFTFLVVVLRYFFKLGWVWLQEVSLYLHSILFLGAAGYTLLRDGHVRIDILYRSMSERRRAWVDLLGSVFLLFPVVGLIFYKALPYVMDSWNVRESSGDSGGLPWVYLLKTMILFYCVTMALQGLSIVLKSSVRILDRGGDR